MESNLGRIRKGRGLSQQKLSELSGINLRLLQDYEQGHKNINGAAVVRIVALAKVLDCNVEDLLEPGE